jgi:hypothetical protein
MKTPKHYRKVLQTIEGLCLLWESGTKASPDKLIGEIYRYAHIGLERCENPHVDWRKELHETHKELKKMGII